MFLNSMSPLKIFTNWAFLFCLISGQAPGQQLESLGLFDFRSAYRNHDFKTDHFFTDSNIMYDTLYETVLNTDSASTNDFISDETKIQKVKTYAQFLKQLSLFRILPVNGDDLRRMTKVPGQKRRIFKNFEINKNSLKENSRQWNLLTKFFDQK